MAHDIKKRSASHIYFGVHSKSGEIMHISKVPSGQKCTCVCAACGQPFEARKGSIRRHHFAHVSNYECMYASEVAIYKALAAELEKTDCLTLPPVMLRFPAWSKDELLQNVKTVRVDSVEFKCEPLAYPPLLTIKAQGSCLRILLDFNHYYDSEDLASLATEAKNDGYSLLKYAMPKLDEDQEFTPDRIMTILKNYEKAEWVFSRLEQHWKEKYYAVAMSLKDMGADTIAPSPLAVTKGNTRQGGSIAHTADSMWLSLQPASVSPRPASRRKKTSREICKIGYPTSIRSGERMKKRSCCAKSEKDISNEDQSILVQHRMLLGMWSHPVLRKRIWMRNISGSARAMTRPLMNGQWIATIGDGSCVRFAAELSRMRRCPITVAREVQTGESVPIVHEMVVANPHSWLDIIRMMVYY